MGPSCGAGTLQPPLDRQSRTRHAGTTNAGGETTLRFLSARRSRAASYALGVAGDQRTASPKSSLISRAGLLYLIGLQGVPAKRIDSVIRCEVSRYSR